MNNHVPDPLAVVLARTLRIILFALLVGPAFPALAQKARPGKSVDLEQLHAKFEAAVGKDFEFVKGELGSGSSLGDDSTDKVPAPRVSKLPFALNTEYNFTEWLADYLPR